MRWMLANWFELVLINDWWDFYYPLKSGQVIWCFDWRAINELENGELDDGLRWPQAMNFGEGVFEFSEKETYFAPSAFQVNQNPLLTFNDFLQKKELQKVIPALMFRSN